MPYVIGTLIVVALVVLYVVSFSLNAKTKTPEGCEVAEDFHGCGSCATNASCGLRVKQKIETKIDIKDVK